MVVVVMMVVVVTAVLAGALVVVDRAAIRSASKLFAPASHSAAPDVIANNAVPRETMHEMLGALYPGYALMLVAVILQAPISA
jgi:hypothetical protein